MIIRMMVIIPVLAVIVFVIVNNFVLNPSSRKASKPTTLNNYTYQPNSYVDITNHAILLFITFGIYQLVWVYRTTKFLNSVEPNKYRSPANKVLLCMFVPMYSVYWCYISAKAVDRMCGKKDLPQDAVVLCTLLAVISSSLANIILQEKINTCVNYK